MFDVEMEMEIRNRSEEAVKSLAKDNRFLAFMDYLEFIYISKLHQYEYEDSRTALIETGHKVCLRELIEDTKRNMNEDQVQDDNLYS